MKIVYTASDKPLLKKCLYHSIKSLASFVDANDIIIISTPPHINDLEISGIIKQRNLYQDYPYADKIYVGLVDDDEVIYLDCDTRINKNIINLLNYNFDVSCRRGSNSDRFTSTRKYTHLLSYLNLSYVPMYNTGFIIFKNKTHKKIMDKWIKNLELLRTKQWDLDFEYVYEQFAFSIATKQLNLNVREMDSTEHFFMWSDNLKDMSNAYVIHYGNQKGKYCNE